MGGGLVLGLTVISVEGSLSNSFRLSVRQRSEKFQDDVSPWCIVLEINKISLFKKKAASWIRHRSFSGKYSAQLADCPWIVHLPSIPQSFTPFSFSLYMCWMEYFIFIFQFHPLICEIGTFPGKIFMDDLRTTPNRFVITARIVRLNVSWLEPGRVNWSLMCRVGKHIDGLALDSLEN